jgi:DNA-binding NarL/FixJ family response regulator
MWEANCGADVRDVTDEFGPPRCHDPRVTLTVLIVDDHAGFRHFARGLLEATGLSVVGEAEDGRSALDAVAKLRPGLVLLDVMLPDLDGFAVADRLSALAQPPAVVLTSSRDSRDFGERLSRSAARGFIRKDDLSGAALERLIAAG